jgi:hypothetical protein
VDSAGGAHNFKFGGKNADGNLIMSVKGNGKVSIGTPSNTLSKMNFNTVYESKIALYSTDNVNCSGFGVSQNSGTGTARHCLNYHIETDEGEHIWYAGGYNGIAGSSKQLARLYHSNFYNRPQMYIGTGFSREYQFELQNDSAYKGGNAFWSTTSDERIKENIEIANYDICYNNIKQLDLKRYKFKEQVLNESKIHDETICGFIAQDVEQYYPKAVTKKERFNIEDCRDIQVDQIYTALYGCVKKLIEKVENLEAEILTLKKSN